MTRGTRGPNRGASAGRDEEGTLEALQGPDQLISDVTRPRVRLDQEGIERLAAIWGRGDDGYFACPIPGHEGRALLIGETGEAELGCCTGRRRSLAEVRAAIAYGVDGLRSNKELAAWWRRLAYELGCLDPVPVDLPPPPAGSTEAEIRVRAGFQLLVSLRRSDHPPEPVAFSVRFGAAWCGLPKNATAVAIRRLRQLDVITVAAQHGSLLLYEPGRGGDPDA